MRRVMNYLTEPIDKILEAIKLTRSGLQNRHPEKLYASRDSRSFYISNKAHVIIQIAAMKGASDGRAYGPADVLEDWAREYAATHLTAKERERVETVTNAITERRQGLINDLIEQQKTESAQ